MPVGIGKILDKPPVFTHEKKGIHVAVGKLAFSAGIEMRSARQGYPLNRGSNQKRLIIRQRFFLAATCRQTAQIEP